DVGRAHGPALGERRRPVLQRVLRERPRAQVPALALPVRLREQAFGQAARPAHPRVLRLRPLEGRPGDRRQGRLLPADLRGRRRRDREADEVDATGEGRGASRRGPTHMTEKTSTQRLLTRVSDRIATSAISGGGLLMIGSLALIFALIVSE